MNYILKTIMIAVALVTAIPSFAVTDKEMEAARTMAAKHYLRYANNGSDYLDKISPSSMSELSAALRQKEKDNLKTFNTVATPKDYASWDKAKLVEYWSTTFFKSPALKEDGKKCLGILAKKLNKINVSAAAPAAEPKAEPAPAESKPEQAAEPAAAAAPASAATPSGDETVAAEEAAAAELDAIAARAAADAGVADEQPKKSSNTGWYVAILIVLIGVVVWLVMYASKSMKEAGAFTADGKSAEKEIREAKKAAKEEANKMREQYASSLAVKNDEIKQLKARVDELEAELDNAREALEQERSRKAMPQQRQQPAVVAQPEPRPAAAPRHDSEPAARTAAGPAAVSKPKPAVKSAKLPPVVYLGYVNQRGLFVKASRSLKPDSSVYYMDIPDGEHGTFMVANDVDVFDRVLADPEYWLGGGCVIENPEDADIAAEIVTLEAGEARFADNTCRVVKKARIKFI